MAKLRKEFVSRFIINKFIAIFLKATDSFRFSLKVFFYEKSIKCDEGFVKEI